MWGSLNWAVGYQNFKRTVHEGNLESSFERGRTECEGWKWWRLFWGFPGHLCSSFYWRLAEEVEKVEHSVCSKKKENVYTNLCKFNQKVEFEDCKDELNSVPYEKCGVRYIGVTGLHFCQRRKQHKGDIRNNKASNGFNSHLKKNKEHSVNWGGAVFLDWEKHWRGRKIKDTLFINS